MEALGKIRDYLELELPPAVKVRNISFAPFHRLVLLKMIILPRQARDKHRETALKKRDACVVKLLMRQPNMDFLLSENASGFWITPTRSHPPRAVAALDPGSWNWSVPTAFPAEPLSSRRFQVPAPVNISMTSCQIQTGWSPRSERSFER